ncbi:MAG: M20/M25/M40 family metallo-hydrolase [Planctomycetes bacterium]|nr:M20/M25/M40 family metallo-hydrolase [Planctomycetota bacterium]
MRTTLRLLSTLLLGTTLAGQGLAVLGYGDDLHLRDRLVAEARVHADLGGRVVARPDAAWLATWRAAGGTSLDLAEPAAGEVFAAVVLGPGAPDLRTVRVLCIQGDLALVAGAAEAVAALRRGGVVHGGVEVIDVRGAPYAAPARLAMGALPAAPDPRIQALVGQVQKSELVRHVQALSALHTRRTNRPENAQAVQYLLTELARYPRLTVKTETFNASYGPNVIAELKGHDQPNDIVMVGAHFDSLVGAGTTAAAPGADDNASGSATVLELARIFATSAAPMQKTLRFAWWNAEELGLIGSNAYATAAKTRGDRIVAYLNTDMNAYRDPSDTVDVDFVTNDSTATLIAFLTQTIQTYVPTLGIKSGPLSAGTSDHRSFFRNGFPAAFLFEDLDRYSPYIHTANDTYGTSANDMDLATLISQSVAAGAAALALPLEAPQVVLDVSSGPAVGGTQVTATGSFLASTTEVRVAGLSVPFTLQGAGVVFTTPVATSLGATTVEVRNPAGPGTAPFTYVKTVPPALRLATTLARGQSHPLAIGGEPGWMEALLVSHLPGSTDLGIIVLDIGGGSPAALVVVQGGALHPVAGTVGFGLPVPNDPTLVGLTFHFQAVTVEPALAGIGKTNAVGATVQ